MAQHFYSSVATLSQLAQQMLQTDSGLYVPQSSFIGYPASYPYTIRLEGGTANEELVDVTGAPIQSGANLYLPVQRGIDGSPTVQHPLNAPVDHPVIARDLTEASSHIYGATGVHGLPAGDAVAGMVELANRTGWTVLQWGSGTFSWSASATAATQVTFPTSFAGTPRVWLTSGAYTNNTPVVTNPAAIGSTGFQARGYVASGASITGTIGFQWWAVY